MGLTLFDGVRARVGEERRQLSRRAAWSLVIEVLQLVSSMVVFFALARLISTDDFGVMTGVMGVAAPAASLSSLGSHILLIKRVAQGEELRDVWRRTTSVGIVGPAVGAAAVIGLKGAIVPGVDTRVYVLLVVSQLNFFWLAELAVTVGNATRRLKEAAGIRFLVVVFRLAALGLFALLGRGSLLWWAAASAVSFALGAVVAVGCIWRLFGARPGLFSLRAADVRHGVPFSVNAVSESLVDVSDRPLLVRYGHESASAVYGVAARIIQFGYLPLHVLLRASDADVYQAGKRGAGAALAVVRRLLGPGIAIGLTVGAGFLLLSPLVPLVAGSGYDRAVVAIRLLAVVPLIRVFQYLMGNCLSASGHQWWRVGATMAAAGVNLGLNVRYLPTGGWRAACYTTVVSELFLTVVLAGAVVGWAAWERRHA